MAQRDSLIPPVVKTVTVNCPPEDAFLYFTADFDKWWPMATHSCVAFASGHSETPAACVFEQRAGGRIVERARSGEEHVWGTVLAWEPPSRVAFTWHPGDDEKRAQVIDVTFRAAPDGTKVVLTHSDFERLGDEAQTARDGYDQGWESVFIQSYPRYIQSQA
jgi:uncharacterized protein YndB with AHSA1/START domain